MDTDSFIVHIKSEDISAGLLKDIEKKFKTWNYDVEIPLAIRKKQENHQINESKIKCEKGKSLLLWD